MFSNLFSGATLYIIIALLASTAGFGYLSYSLYGDRAVAVAQLKDANDAIVGYQNSLNLKESSCKIDDTSVVEVETEKKDLQNKVDAVSDKFDKLKVITATKPSVKQEIINHETNVLPDDGILSPNITSLLNEGWCDSFPTDDICRAK
jgi:hypothetical protein